MPINECGKIIIPQSESLDHQLDLLYERATKNGAEVEIINNADLKRMEPQAHSSTGRALWSPNTVVVKSKVVLNKLRSGIKRKGS